VAVGRQGAGRAPALDLEPGEVLLGLAGQTAPSRQPALVAQALAGQVEPSTVDSSLSEQRPPARRRRRGGSFQWSCSPLHALGPGRNGGEACRQVDEGLLVADPGRVPGPEEQFPSGRLQARFLSKLAAGRGFGLLPLVVARPGRQLEHVRIDRGPKLAHQRHRAIVVHGDDGDGAGMADDEPVEGLVVRVEQVEAVHPEEPGPEELLLRDSAEPGTGLGDGVEIEQVGLAPLRPLQRRRDELPELFLLLLLFIEGRV